MVSLPVPVDGEHEIELLEMACGMGGVGSVVIKRIFSLSLLAMQGRGRDFMFSEDHLLESSSVLVKARARYLHGQTRDMIAAVVRWSPQPMLFIFSVNILFHRSPLSPTCIPSWTRMPP